jgi:hypothetical protein
MLKNYKDLKVWQKAYQEKTGFKDSRGQGFMGNAKKL